MDRIEPDQTPAEAWKSSLDATCNRLMSHYHGLLRAAAAPPPRRPIATVPEEEAGGEEEEAEAGGAEAG